MSTAPTEVDINIHDVNRFVAPGRERAPFFRYFRFNLPRLTKALLLIVIAVIGGCAAGVAYSGFSIFPGDHVALLLVAILAGVCVLLGLTTAWRIWDAGLLPALAALTLYIGGLLSHAPYVWNGASVYLAATWNTMAFAAVAYLLLDWALNYGILVAYPDDQGFCD